MAAALVLGLGAPFSLSLPTTGEKARDFIAQYRGVPTDELRLLRNGAEIFDADTLSPDAEAAPVRVLLRLEGGKGGFGSMLRLLGAKTSGHETDNIESCRDINGRRIRHVNDEKRIAEWLAQQKNDEEEKEKRRLEKLERRTIAPKHTFDHHAFAVGLAEQAQEVKDAIQQGLRTKPTAAPAAPARKARFMDDDLDSAEESEGVEEAEASSDGEGTAAEPVRGELTDLPSTSHTSASAPASKADDKHASELKEQPVESAAPAPAQQEPTESTTTTTTSAPAPAAPAAPAAESTAPKAQVVPEALDLTKYDSIEALEALGLDRLKAALMAADEKCGGTLRQRAERLFALKGKKSHKKKQK